MNVQLLQDLGKVDIWLIQQNIFYYIRNVVYQILIIIHILSWNLKQ